ncbi:MAG: apolipoprotein N-acyltransferase, partial [Sphingosinicella sp.]
MTYLLTLVAGLVSALGFAPVGAWPLTLFACALLLWQVEQAPSGRAAMAHGWWFGAGQCALGLNWIATAFTFQAAMPPAFGWVAVLLLSLYLALFPALAAWLAWGRRRHGLTAFVLAFAAAWIVGEWLRAIVFTGFAWNPLAVAFLDSGLAGPARWIGTYGLSGLMLLFAGGLFLLARAARREGALLLGAV